MYAKLRKNSIVLYRTTYVPKGEAGNSRGYVVEEIVGSLPPDSQTIPHLLAKKLTAAERKFVRRRIGNQSSIESEREEAPATMTSRSEVPHA